MISRTMQIAYDLPRSPINKRTLSQAEAAEWRALLFRPVTPIPWEPAEQIERKYRLKSFLEYLFDFNRGLNVDVVCKSSEQPVGAKWSLDRFFRELNLAGYRTVWFPASGGSGRRLVIVEFAPGYFESSFLAHNLQVRFLGEQHAVTGALAASTQGSSLPEALLGDWDGNWDGYITTLAGLGVPGVELAVRAEEAWGAYGEAQTILMDAHLADDNAVSPYPQAAEEWATYEAAVEAALAVGRY